MSITIPLPQHFNLQAIYRFTRPIVDGHGLPASESFLFDFEPLHFIDGSGYTVLSNTLEWLLSHEIDCRFTNFAKEREAIFYLDDCGFFRRYLAGPLRNSAGCRSTTLPCTPVQHAQAHGWLETSFSPWMCRHLNVSHGALASIRTCIKEIFNNIIDHSEQDTGFIHAQYYPVNKIINITVSDFGKGIPTTIKERFGDMTDQAAIFMASQEGVTAKSQPNNMGAGLNYLIDRVTGCYGSVRIHSLGGNLNCFRDRKGTYRKPAFGNGNYPGTLIDISLDTRLFEGDEEERVDFEW